MVEHSASMGKVLGLILTTVKETNSQNPLTVTSREMDLLSRVAHSQERSSVCPCKRSLSGLAL